MKIKYTVISGYTFRVSSSVRLGREASPKKSKREREREKEEGKKREREVVGEMAIFWCCGTSDISSHLS
jgi:hypothetical protein